MTRRADIGRTEGNAVRKQIAIFLNATAFLCLTSPLPLVTATPVTTSSEAHVETLFDVGSLSGSPFPSNRFTVPDAGQLTGRHVNLPKPDCAARPSDCEDIDVLNTLDGFNLQPRLSIPFD